VAQAEVVLDQQTDRAEAGRRDLFDLDECRFAPSLPTGSRRSLPGQRKREQYESPQGHRVTVLARYRLVGASPRLAATAFERTLSADDLLG
jgi:hypothetical protein